MMTSPTCPTCGVGVREHEASECLDAWVDRAVFGIKLKLVDVVRINGRWYAGDVWLYEDEDPAEPAAGCSPAGRIRPFSSRIAAACQVVEKMCDDHGVLFRIHQRTDFHWRDSNWAGFNRWGENRLVAEADAGAAPLAICRAAILALEGEEDEPTT